MILKRKKEKTAMDLRTRIGIAFILVILIPVLLCSAAFYVLMNYKVRQLGRQYGIDNPGMESLYNNALLISKTLDETLSSVQHTLENDPDRLEDKRYLKELNETLSGNGAFIVVRKGNSIYYNGSTDLSNAELLSQLPSSADGISGNEENGENSYIQVRNQAMLKQISFRFSDGSRGSIFLISMLNQLAPEIKGAMTETILLIIVILSFTSIAMGIWIYRGVIIPINQLKKAAQNIRDGNLNFVTQKSGIKEMDDLCDDFEEMRVRLKESAEEKIRFDAQNRELISNISHDMKTPVTAIKGYTEGLIDGVAATPEKQQRYIRTIYNKTIEITRLIDELTMYSKIDTNRIPYNFQKIHASSYFEDCREELSMELEQQNIRLNYSNDLVDDAVIIADPEQLRRVINNIVGNSVKYMDKDPGIISIRLRDVGDFIQVEIEDNGRGINQKDIPRIFDRFYRSDQARRARGGSGIGLSIVKKIIEDHEGKVWATSREGEGTVIYFVLRKYQEGRHEQNSNH